MRSPSPLVSIIVATYNAGDQLQRCIDSISSQAAGLAELVVIDGGSTDATLAVVRRNAGSIAHWESARDKGIADAWNKGLAHVRGSWVIFLGADDVFADSSVLERFRPVLEAARDELVVFGKVVLEGGPFDGQVLGEPWRWEKFRMRMTIPHQGAFHQVRLFREYGTFDPALRLSADYEMLLRPGRSLQPRYVDQVVCVMGGEGVSIRSPLLSFKEASEAQARHRVAPRVLIYGFRLYASVRSLLRKLPGA